MSGGRLRIFVYMTGGPHWIGGVQYTRNLLRSVALLPAAERPEIVLRVGGKNRNSGYEAEFDRYPDLTIDAPLKSRFELLARSLAARLTGSVPATPRWLSDDCTVAFPIKVADFPGSFEKVFWIPDFQYKRFPGHFTAEDTAERDRMYGRMLEGEVILVLSSESVRDDFRRFFPSLEQVRARVLRFYSVFEDEEYASAPAEVTSRYELPETFAYLPNQFYLHKGHDTVFAALAALKGEGISVPLVCTGSSHDYRTEAHIAPMLKFIDDHGLAPQIRILGMIPRADQIQIFRQAALVLQPSMSEGWSTTVEDARALGKDIILSDIEVHQEQAPAYGRFFPTGDAESLAGVIREVWPACRSGVQPEREARAREESRRNGLAFARTFVEIVREADALHRARPAQARPGTVAC